MQPVYRVATDGWRIPKPRANNLLKMTDELLRLESAVLLEHLTLASTFNAQLFHRGSVKALVNRDTETRTNVLPARDQLWNDSVHRINRYGKAHARRCPRRAENCRVHTDQPAGAVQQWST